MKNTDACNKYRVRVFERFQDVDVPHEDVTMTREPQKTHETGQTFNRNHTCHVTAEKKHNSITCTVNVEDEFKNTYLR